MALMTAKQYLNAKWTAIEAAVALTTGLDHVEKWYDEKTLDAASKEFSYGITFRQLLLLGARENGYQSYATSDIGPLYDAAFAIKGSGGFSDANVPGVLSNVANKYLNEGFNAVEGGWRDITAKRSVPNFKQSSSYSLTGDLTFEEVGPAGELKSATMGEAKYTNQLKTYGKLLKISRIDFLNDDLGAFTSAAQKLGRGAGLAANKVFWAAFLANVSTMFTSGNANVITGGGSALSATSLGLAQQAFRKQTDPDGNPLGVVPKILLVPPELEISADTLLHSTSFVAGGASTETQIPNQNPYTAKFRPVVASYLSNTTYTGYSTTAWYLLADPRDMPVMEVSTLNGRETPVIDTKEPDSGTMSFHMRAYMDFGIGTMEYRGGVRSAGA